MTQRGGREGKQKRIICEEQIAQQRRRRFPERRGALGTGGGAGGDGHRGPEVRSWEAGEW